MKYMFTPEELDLLDSYPDAADDEDAALDKPDLEKLGGKAKDDVKEELYLGIFGHIWGRWWWLGIWDGRWRL